MGAPTPEQVTGLTGDQLQAWAAIRARLVVEHPWLTPALFRAVPAARPAADPTAPDRGGLADADRWGRVYVDLDAERTHGIAAVADQVTTALLTWVSGTTSARPWHLSVFDDRVPVAGGTDPDTPGGPGAENVGPRPMRGMARVARQVAAGVLSERPGYGDDPFAGFRDWAHQVAGPPQLPWTEKLGAHLRGAVAARAGYQRYTYTRPGRRQLPGVILPAHRSPAIHLAVIGDISGSVTPDLPYLTAEIAGITSAVGLSGGTATLYTVDDEVAGVAPMPGTPEMFAPRPGHLTDLRAGFTALTGAHPAPDVVVVLTDGATPWPDSPPTDAVVIVVLIGTAAAVDRGRGNVPGWADTLTVSPGPAAQATD